MANDQAPIPPPNPDPNPNPSPNPNSNPSPLAKAKLPIKRRSSPLSLSSPPPAADDPAPPPPPPPAPAALAAAASSQPFKFQRVWSESDELRFLQGLLGCRAQGLVFPRDLNLFYDRFSESMPQPFTRSQLSEKLRRLRNKHRAASARAVSARRDLGSGAESPSLTPHDRDVLHLCDRLWDPSFAASSPFQASLTGEAGNRRRRVSPGRPGHLGSSVDDNGDCGENLGSSVACVENGNANGVKNDRKQALAEAILDLFDECVKEVGREGGAFSFSQGEDEFAKRWKAQQMEELEVLSKRLRLSIAEAAGW